MTRSQLPKHLLRSGSVLALVALVSACSSSNNAARTTGQTPPPTTPATFAELLEQQVSNSENAEEAADMAAKKATDALASARKAGDMLTPAATKGASSVIMTNAQAILMAQTDIGAAVTALEAELAKANTVKTELGKLKTTTDAEKARLGREQTRIDTLIAAINAQIAAAKKIQSGASDDDDETDEITDLVKMVQGMDADMPMTAAMFASSQAKLVSDALGKLTAEDKVSKTLAAFKKAKTDDMVFAHGTTLPDGAQKFAEIFDNVTSSTIAVIDGNAVPGFSIEGLTPEQVINSDDVEIRRAQLFRSRLLSSNPVETSGYSLVTHNGLTGLIYKIPGAALYPDDNSTAFETGWYFVPKQDGYFTRNADGSYKAERFAEYGSWLDDNSKLHRYAGPGEGSAASGAAFRVTTRPASGSGSSAVTAVKSASYTGTAGGLATRKTFKPDGTEDTFASGHFNADVSLTATFGAAFADRNLKGEVTNFRAANSASEDAVDTRWKVTLKSTGLLNDGTGLGSDGTTAAQGVAEGDKSEGVSHWTATAFGVGGSGASAVESSNSNDAYAAGYTGTFDARFKNGHVAGTYATDERTLNE